MQRKTIAFIVASALLVGCILGFAFLPHDQPSSVVVGWQWPPSPQFESIVGLWETSPGYYQAFSVRRENDEWIADWQGPRTVLKTTEPTIWSRLP